MKIRKRYIIIPNVQWTLVLVNLIGLIFFFGISTLFVCYSFSQMIDLGHQSHLPESHVYYQFITAQLKDLIKYLLLSLCCTGAIGTVFFIWFSHHLVGPIVGLTSYLKKYKESQKEGLQLKPLKVRKGDYFQELAESINEVLQTEEKD